MNSQKVKAISTKGLTEDLINKFSVLNAAKYFSSGIFQNYLLFISAKKHIEYFSATTRIDSWKPNGMSEENIENMAFRPETLLKNGSNTGVFL